MEEKNRKFKKSQVIFEYIAIFAIVIAAIASIRFLPKIKASFTNHRDQCINVIIKSKG